MSKAKAQAPDHISEEYYQIAPEILSSFSKYRPPLDLHRFREEIGRLEPYSRKNQRLTNAQVEEVLALCAEGLLFVSRSDHPIYSKHIVRQVDLVLVDKHLKEAEIADVLIQAFELRLDALFEQPVQPVLDRFYQDLLVFTEYLTQDPNRIRSLIRRMKTEHNLVNHSINTAIMGTWAFIKSKEGKQSRRELDRAVAGLFLHDLGMCKIPLFVRSKTIPLSPEERTKISRHSQAGHLIAQKLNLVFDEMRAATLEHHERLDGSGYPNRAGAELLSPFGKLVAVIDAYCAMLTDRPYAKAQTPKEAAQELMRLENQFDRRISGMILAALTVGEL